MSIEMTEEQMFALILEKLEEINAKFCSFADPLTSASSPPTPISIADTEDHGLRDIISTESNTTATTSCSTSLASSPPRDAADVVPVKTTELMEMAPTRCSTLVPYQAASASVFAVTPAALPTPSSTSAPLQDIALADSIAATKQPVMTPARCSMPGGSRDLGAVIHEVNPDISPVSCRAISVFDIANTSSAPTIDALIGSSSIGAHTTHEVFEAVSTLSSHGNLSNELKGIAPEPPWLGLQRPCLQMEIEDNGIKVRPTPWPPFWRIRPALLLMSPWPPPSSEMILLQKHWCLDKLEARTGNRPHTTSEIIGLSSTEADVTVQDNSSKFISSRLTTVSSEIYGVSDIHKEFERSPRPCPSFSTYESKAGANGLSYFEMGANFWQYKDWLKIYLKYEFSHEVHHWHSSEGVQSVLLVVMERLHLNLHAQQEQTAHVSSWRMPTLLNIYYIHILGLNWVCFTEMQQVVDIHWKSYQTELSGAQYCYGRHLLQVIVTYKIILLDETLDVTTHRWNWKKEISGCASNIPVIQNWVTAEELFDCTNDGWITIVIKELHLAWHTCAGANIPNHTAFIRNTLHCSAPTLSAMNKFEYQVNQLLFSEYDYSRGAQELKNVIYVCISSDASVCKVAQLQSRAVFHQALLSELLDNTILLKAASEKVFQVHGAMQWSGFLQIILSTSLQVPWDPASRNLYCNCGSQVQKMEYLLPLDCQPGISWCDQGASSSYIQVIQDQDNGASSHASIKNGLGTSRVFRGGRM